MLGGHSLILSDIDITKAIIEAVQATLHEKEMTKIAVDMDSPLNEELGLDSLDCAVVIIRLEEVLDVDPF